MAHHVRPTAALRLRLLVYVEAQNFKGLCEHLSALRTTDFRAAGIVLSEAQFWSTLSDEAFWEAFSILAGTHPRAYLGTLLKAATGRFLHRSFSPKTRPLVIYAREIASPIDCNKCLTVLLPLVSHPEDAQELLNMFLSEDPDGKKAAPYLFRATTPAAYYLLFQHLRHHEDRKPYLRRVAVELMHKGDKTSFNLAGILRTYFDLGDLPGTFALRLPVYELSRLDNGFEEFLKIIKR